MRYTYNWKWVYNLAVYSLHGILRRHVVGVDMESGRPFCDGCAPVAAPPDAGKAGEKP